MTQSRAQTMRGTIARTRRWPNVKRASGGVVTGSILSAAISIPPSSQNRDLGHPALFCSLSTALAVAQPADELGEGGALAVHENADAVEARGDPQHRPDAHNHEPDGGSELP